MKGSVYFKLHDPFSNHRIVNVAGSFNEWNSSSDSLNFDKNSKMWTLQRSVDLPEGDKVLYKFVVDDTQWICDFSAPLEKDSEGNDNNIGYVVVEGNESGSYDSDTNKNTILDYTSSQKDDLFGETKKARDGVISSDGGNEILESFENSQTTIKSTNNKHLVSLDDGTGTLAQSKRFSFVSIWKSLTWFVGYYLFSWFHSNIQREN